MANEITLTEFESFFVNHHDFERLKIYLSQFNPIRVMRMESMEIRHSAILTWLLDPHETHGFGDQFLKSFLSEAVKGNLNSKPSSIEIYQSDLRDAEVKREWLNIDIFIKSENNKWAFIVENKVYSKQSKEQLSKYKEKAKQYFDDTISIVGIFLTLNDEEADDASFVQIYYSDVLRILNQLIERNQSMLDENVLYFLRFYAETVSIKTGENVKQSEFENLARKLYREHKKVLDFIYEYGAVTDFESAAQELFGENLDFLAVIEINEQEFLYNWHGNSSFSFIPKKWTDSIGGVEFKDNWKGCESWWAGFPLICWFSLTENEDKATLRLFAEVGSLSNHEVRSSLIDSICSVDHKLIRINVKEAKKESAKYSKFFKDNSILIENTQDIEEIKSAMEKLLTKFNDPIDSVSEKLKEWYGSIKDKLP